MTRDSGALPSLTTVALCEARIAQLESAVRLAYEHFKEEEYVAMADAMADALDPIGSLADYMKEPTS